MTRFILAALLAVSAAPALAQSANGPNTYVSNPGIPVADTGPRYCPELAGTEHPFRIRCPSWPDYGSVAIDALARISFGQGVVGDTHGGLLEEQPEVGSNSSILVEEGDQD
jgi:hypothetical protein